MAPALQASGMQGAAGQYRAAVGHSEQSAPDTLAGDLQGNAFAMATVSFSV